MAPRHKVSIEHILIRIGEKDVEMTVDQAEELHKILADMFREPQVVTHPYPVYIERPWVRWTTGTEYRMEWTAGDGTTEIRKLQHSADRANTVVITAQAP